MSITKSFNRRTNTWYAYETNYVWDEALQKKIQKRKCIGKFDPELNQIIKNGPRGRPQLTAEAIAKNKSSVVSATVSNTSLNALLLRLEEIEKISNSLSKEVSVLKAEVKALMQPSTSEQESK